MTTLIEAGEPVVLKTDETGRVRTPAARREHLLDEYEHSGLSGAKFAALAGIKYSPSALLLGFTAAAGGGSGTPPTPPTPPATPGK